MLWAADPDDEHLHRCWRLQNCGDCMKREARCSWCPFTSSCVPNNYIVPALAPAFNEDICPHWAERWEIRTHPLGCQVSTITSLTSIVTIFSTLIFVLLVYLAVWSIRKLRRLNEQKPGWWRRRDSWAPIGFVMPWLWFRQRRSEPEEDGETGEHEPLLGRVTSNWS